MRENCTYGSMRGRAYPITRGVPLYPDFPRSHPISTFPKRITDKMGANADRFAGYCLRKTGKFV